MKQWHPVFVEILRPWLEGYFEILTNVPVGDVPREADLVLLHRVNTGPAPFEGIWRHLVTWNIVEFKDPSVSTRPRDIDYLVELGLGIDRRLNGEQSKQGRKLVSATEISFWYLANHLGKNFIDRAEKRLGGLHSGEPGIWRGTILEHPLYLVSRRDVAVEPDTIPLHLVADEPISTEEQVFRLLLEKDALWEEFSDWFIFFHSRAIERMRNMAATKGRGLRIDIAPLLKHIEVKDLITHLSEALKQLPPEEARKQVRKVLKQISPEELLAGLSTGQVTELKKLLK